ncbi:MULTISPECIES: hypothetical protein [unclassified Synechococcus]|jgi:formamidase|nr:MULTISPECIES: hypothetical protein [unclassified Synechococcus]
MQDLVNGAYRLPWEEKVIHKDGSACGFPPATRLYQESSLTEAAYTGST